MKQAYIYTEKPVSAHNVLDNATYLTVSQYFNQNLRSLLYSDLATWLNLKPGGYGSKKFSSRAGVRKTLLTPCWGVWGHAPPENFEN